MAGTSNIKIRLANESKNKAAPFLKWAGGKRWLAPHIEPLINEHARLVEPFVGSGAVFFKTAPSAAILGDVNTDLMATYRAVRNQPNALLNRLAGLRINLDTFERMRQWRPTSVLDRAVRLIYLNRTAFNGLYRVNRLGGFNVPFGCKKGTRLCDWVSIRSASRALAKAQIVRQDFRDTLSEVRPGDVVYADPPYTVKHDNNGFRRYNETIFSWQDQKDLASSLLKLAKNDAQVIVSNAHHDTIRAMYSKVTFRAFVVTRTTCMAGNASRRGTCQEWLLVSRNFGDALDQLQNIIGWRAAA
jgi:DNA adenine methylase